jgi:hypothetical protein
MTSVDIDFNGMSGKDITFFHDDCLFRLGITEVMAIQSFVEEVRFDVVHNTVWQIGFASKHLASLYTFNCQKGLYQGLVYSDLTRSSLLSHPSLQTTRHRFNLVEGQIDGEVCRRVRSWSLMYSAVFVLNIETFD